MNKNDNTLKLAKPEKFETLNCDKNEQDEICDEYECLYDIDIKTAKQYVEKTEDYFNKLKKRALIFIQPLYHRLIIESTQ